MSSATTLDHRRDRLTRAWALVKAGGVQHIAGSQYVVRGSHEKFYHVDIAEDPPCFCMDMEMRGEIIGWFCKHVGAARLASLDPELVAIVAEWITQEADNE